MFSGSNILKMLLVAVIPFIVLFLTKKKPYFKQKPHMLYFVMVAPTMLVGYLLFLIK